MIKYILALSILSAPAFAECKDQCQPKKPAPKVVYVTKTVKEPCCDKTSPVNQDTKASQGTRVSTPSSSQAATGPQTVTINIPTTKVIRKTVYRQRTKKVNVYHFNPNRLQLLLGASKTKLDVESDDCCHYKAKRKYETDIGLQYLRDFGGFTGSIIGTTNKSLYLGLGFNW